MDLLNYGDFAKLLFHADGMGLMYLSASKKLDALVAFLNGIRSGKSKGELSIINGPSGCGKTMLMKSFCQELAEFGKSYSFQTSQQFVTDLILAISRGGITPLLHKTCDVYVLDDCFSLFPETLKDIDQIHKASPSTSMFLLFDACIPLEKYVLPRLHVDNVFDTPTPCEAAIKAFVRDYLDSEASRRLNVSLDRALAIASEHMHIAALRSAIQRESIERRYRHGAD